MAANNLRMKTVLSAKGEICIAYADPDSAGSSCKYQTIEGNSDGTNLIMNLGLIKVDKGHMKHFTA